MPDYTEPGKGHASLFFNLFRLSLICFEFVIFEYFGIPKMYLTETDEKMRLQLRNLEKLEITHTKTETVYTKD